MRTTTRKLLLSTAVLFAGIGLASAQTMQGSGGREHGGAAISNGQPGASARERSHGDAAMPRGEHGASRETTGTGGRLDSPAAKPKAQSGGSERNARDNAVGAGHERVGTTGAAGRDDKGSSRNAPHEGATPHAQDRSTTGQATSAKDAASQQRVQTRSHAQTKGSATTGQAASDKNAAPKGRNDQAQSRDRTSTTTGQGPADKKGTADKNTASKTQRDEQARSRTNAPTTTGQGTSDPHQRTGAEDRGNNGAENRNQVGVNVQQNDRDRVELNSQQQTHVRETVLSRREVPRVDRVDFELRAGTVVPERVHYVSVTEYPALVEVLPPEYRHDNFFVTEDEIVVLTPQRRIAKIIPLHGSARVGASSQTETVELTSTEIREVQEVLVRRGYHVEVDGNWGPTTRQALIEFQQREGLPARGVITAQTVTSLGLQGKIAESHIQRSSETNGQGNVQGDVRGTGRDNEGRAGDPRSNARQDDKDTERNNAGAAQNSRSTNGLGDKSDRNRNARGNDRSSRDNAAGGRGNSRPPQDSSATNGAGKPGKETNGQGNHEAGRDNATAGQGRSPSTQPRSTTGQGEAGSRGHAGGEPGGAGLGSEGNRQPGKAQQR